MGLTSIDLNLRLQFIGCLRFFVWLYRRHYIWFQGHVQGQHIFAYNDMASNFSLILYAIDTALQIKHYIF